jgi:mannose-6-phosphate isomerase class I
MLSNRPYKLSELGFDDTKPWGNTQKASQLYPNLSGSFKPSTDTERVGEIFLFSPFNESPSKTSITKDISTVDYFSYWHALTSTQKEGLFDCGTLTSDITHYDLVPLFAKVLFADRPLSIQVHDENREENGLFIAGKTEAWIALEDHVELFIGFKPGMKQAFMNNVASFRSSYTTVDDMKAYFNHYTLNKGEGILILPGSVHAILKGTLYEIQQPSNITKRVLDIEKKLPRNCDFNLDNERDLFLYNSYFDTIPKKYIPNDEGQYQFDTPYFATQEIRKSQSVCINDSFSVLFCAQGPITISSPDFNETLNNGDVLLIPANYSWNTECDSHCRAYLSYLPHHFKDPFS